MAWLQLRLDTGADDVEVLEELLLATGAVSVTLQDNANQPLLEPGVGETPLWGQIRLTGLYPADTAIEQVLAAFPASLAQRANPRAEILEDKDWEREWMQHYRPMSFGTRLWVCPSWLEPPNPAAVNLLLDPGLAFGTGTHPTTALCLGELDGLEMEGLSVVDYGCGSGILAIAALKLGACEALGVDIDPQALAASRENAARNGIPAECLYLVRPDELDGASWQHRADLVIANILAGPLIELAGTLMHFLKPGGTLLLSGLLASQAQALIGHYGDQIPLRLASQQDDWVCLCGQRQGN